MDTDIVAEADMVMGEVYTNRSGTRWRALRREPGNGVQLISEMYQHPRYMWAGAMGPMKKYQPDAERK